MIAQSSGLSYKLDPLFTPTPPPQEPAPAQGTPFDVPTPPNEKLANVEGMTAEYYNAYSRLKNFTNQMWQEQGIDVTKPDLSQPDGGPLHNAWLHLTGNLQMVAQDLVQQRKWQEEAFTSAMKGESITTFDPSKKLFKETQEGVVSTNIMPEVEAALRLAQNVYGTQAEAESAWNNQILPLKQKLLDQQRINPENAEFYQRNIDALPQAYTWEKKGSGGGINIGLGPNKKDEFNLDYRPVLLNEGYWKDNINNVDYTIIDGKKAAWLPNEATSNEVYGEEQMPRADGTYQKVAKEVAGRYMLENGDVYIKFKDPQFQDVKVSGQSADIQLEQYYAASGEMGQSYLNKYLDFANKLRRSLNTGSLRIGDLVKAGQFPQNLIDDGNTAKKQIINQIPNAKASAGVSAAIGKLFGNNP